VKAKILYVSIFSGAIIFNILLATVFCDLTDVSDYAEYVLYQSTTKRSEVEKAAQLTIITYFKYLSSISENPLIPFRALAVSAGIRASPAFMGPPHGRGEFVTLE
jgi:hypothetical protein